MSTRTPEEIITDLELDMVWGNANFGDVSKRDVVYEAIKKVAQGWSNGSTSTAIIRELGLTEHRNNYDGLSDKGLEYFIAASQQPQHHASAVDHEKVWVWRTDNPGKDVNDTFVCIIEQRGNGKVTQKPAYAQWMYSSWMTEECWKVIEWLESTPLPNEATIEKIKEYLFNTANAGENINADYLKQTIEFLQSLSGGNEGEAVRLLKELLMFCEPDGTVVEGFRTKEIIQSIKDYLQSL